MSNVGDRTEQVRAEAAQWVARLATRPVPTDVLALFMIWRKVPEHRAAYDEAAGVWDASADLATRPDMRALAEEAYQRGRRQRRSTLGRRFGLPVAGLVAVALAIGVTHGLDGAAKSETYGTKVGEQSEVALDDGSRVSLDTDTRLRVRFSPTLRHVDLEHGQAFFTVAHNAARPFVVDADHTDVTATGTQFAVRRLGDEVAVTLVEGGVAVAPPNRPKTQLGAGQQWSLRRDQAPQVRAVDTGVATAWKQGRIVLDDTPLAAAIAEVNRYARKPVKLDSERFAGERVGGSFATGDIASFVAAVTAVLPLAAVRGTDGSIHLASHDPAAGKGVPPAA